MSLVAPTFDDVLLAAENIRAKSIRTPLVKLNCITDVNIYLKLENLQEIGSFKVRAAGNAVASLRRKYKNLRGVVTASAGNFGQGLAWYCGEYGISCTCIVPDTAPKTKIEGMKRLGYVFFFFNSSHKKYQLETSIHLTESERKLFMCRMQSGGKSLRHINVMILHLKVLYLCILVRRMQFLQAMQPLHWK